MPRLVPFEQKADSTKKITPHNLSSRMKAALRLVFDGWSQADICEATGYNQCRISVIVNSPVGKAYLAELDKATLDKVATAQADFAVSKNKMAIRERLETEAAASLETLLAIRDGSADPRLTATVSMDLLDRAGYKGPDKVEIDARVLATQPVIDALQFLRARQEKKVV